MKNPLTKRQSEVVRLTSLGCTAQEIATILGIATSSVDDYKKKALRTLGTDRSVLLTRFAIKLNIAPTNEKLTTEEKRKIDWYEDGWN